MIPAVIVLLVLATATIGLLAWRGRGQKSARQQAATDGGFLPLYAQPGGGEHNHSPDCGHGDTGSGDSGAGDGGGGGGD